MNKGINVITDKQFTSNFCLFFKPTHNRIEQRTCHEQGPLRYMKEQEHRYVVVIKELTHRWRQHGCCGYLVPSHRAMISLEILSICSERKKAS